MGSHRWHWTVKSWLSALAVLNGGRGIFPYIFLLVDHFKWALIGNIGQQSWLSALAVLNGGRGIFPYIFLLVDRFEWALIGDIGQQRVDSVLWQFQMGGGLIISFTWVNLKIWARFKFCSCFTELFHFL